MKYQRCTANGNTYATVAYLSDFAEEKLTLDRLVERLVEFRDSLPEIDRPHVSLREESWDDGSAWEFYLSRPATPHEDAVARARDELDRACREQEREKRELEAYERLRVKYEREYRPRLHLENLTVVGMQAFEALPLEQKMELAEALARAREHASRLAGEET